MRKSDKVLRHQARLSWYKKLGKRKNGAQRIHELRDSDLHFGIPRRNMRWRAHIIQGGWKDE